MRIICRSMGNILATTSLEKISVLETIKCQYMHSKVQRIVRSILLMNFACLWIIRMNEDSCEHSPQGSQTCNYNCKVFNTAIIMTFIPVSVPQQFYMMTYRIKWVATYCWTLQIFSIFSFRLLLWQKWKKCSLFTLYAFVFNISIVFIWFPRKHYKSWL